LAARYASLIRRGRLHFRGRPKPAIEGHFKPANDKPLNQDVYSDAKGAITLPGCELRLERTNQTQVIALGRRRIQKTTTVRRETAAGYLRERLGSRYGRQAYGGMGRRAQPSLPPPGGCVVVLDNPARECLIPLSTILRSTPTARRVPKEGSGSCEATQLILHPVAVFGCRRSREQREHEWTVAVPEPAEKVSSVPRPGEHQDELGGSRNR
jgi:hypothetical protein